MGWSTVPQNNSNAPHWARGRSVSNPNEFTGLAQEMTAGSQKIWNNISGMNGTPFQTRDHFLQVLGKWESYIPLDQLWMVVFDIPYPVRESVLEKWGERHIAQPWGVNEVRKRFENDFYMKAQGCCLAQTVNIPTEMAKIKQVGPTNRGFLKGPIMDARQDFASLNIEFLETTLSFVDFLIRPWIIISQHQGLVARQGPKGSYLGETSIAQKITTDIFVVQFMRAGTNFIDKPDTHWHENTQGFLPRKMWLFKDASPINTGAQRFSYTPGGNIPRRNIEWAFRKYQVMNLPSAVKRMDQIQANDTKSIPHPKGRKEVYPEKGSKYSRVRTQVNPPYDTDLSGKSKPSPAVVRGTKDIMVKEKFKSGKPLEREIRRSVKGTTVKEKFPSGKNIKKGLKDIMVKEKFPSGKNIKKGLRDIMVKEKFPSGKNIKKGLRDIMVKEKFPPGEKVDDPERPWTKKFDTDLK
jgi:Mor family transcriptional regulator